jgi:hypothetical protein
MDLKVDAVVAAAASPPVINAPMRNFEPDHERQVSDAEAVLYRTIQATDPDTGEVYLKKVETPLYRDYLANQTAYHKARAAYTNALQEAEKTEAGRRSWPMIASTLQLPVKQAYDCWRAASADKIEQALAVISKGSPRRSP